MVSTWKIVQPSFDRQGTTTPVPNSSRHKAAQAHKDKQAGDHDHHREAIKHPDVTPPPKKINTNIICFTIYRPLLLRHLLLPRWRCRSPTFVTTTTTVAAASSIATATALASDSATPSAWNSAPLLQPHPLSLIFHRFYYRDSSHSPRTFISQSSSSGGIWSQYFLKQQKRHRSFKTNIMSRSR